MKHGPAARQITAAAVTEPSRAGRNIGVLGDAEIGTGTRNEFLVVGDRASRVQRRFEFPAKLLQALSRRASTDRQSETLRGKPRQLLKTFKFAILVPIFAAVNRHVRASRPMH